MHVLLYGARAAVHDYHTDTPGSFDAVVARLEAARASGAPALVTTPLTRSSFRVLSDLPPLLRSRSVSAWHLSVPTAHGPLPFERWMPRLGLAMPHALHALGRATRLGLRARIHGAPLCLLGPHVALCLPSPDRSYGEACARCPARTVCPGLDATYLARFGGDELRPRDDLPVLAGEAPELAALASTVPFDGAPGA